MATMTTTDCSHNIDKNRLVREGTSQAQRFAAALDPSSMLVNERTAAHSLVFAQAYAAYLRFFDEKDIDIGDWKAFFSNDVSAQLAIAVVQDVEVYKSTLNTHFKFLNNNKNSNPEADLDLEKNLGALFNIIGSLARWLDQFKESLPEGHALKGILSRLIQNQLSLSFRRLIAYYNAGIKRSLINLSAVHNLNILGQPVISFKDAIATKFSIDWLDAAGVHDWNSYKGISEAEYASVYGSDKMSVFDQVNAIATNNQFTTIFDQFLRAYARLVSDAKTAMEESYRQPDHDPHFALFLAFLRLFEYARAETNTLTRRHLDFYYREILRLKEKGAEPGHAHLFVELAKQVPSHLIASGEHFKAGKDARGVEAFFANDRDIVVNQAKVTALKTVYRCNQGIGLFALPVANSADGLGAKLNTPDQSWHPFFNELYQDKTPDKIDMPEAEIGFAIASHYIWLAGGQRVITVEFKAKDTISTPITCKAEDFVYQLTSEKEWFEVDPVKAVSLTIKDTKLTFTLTLTGAVPAIMPYVAKTHGYQFETDLPLLLIKLRHGVSNVIYSKLQDISIESIDLSVEVNGLKSMAVSNDFGPIDTSKPFQPYGATPHAGSSLIVGSKELFQKGINKASLHIGWSVAAIYYPNEPVAIPKVYVYFLSPEGTWVDVVNTYLSAPDGRDILHDIITNIDYCLKGTWDRNKRLSAINSPDFTPNEFYNQTSQYGFIRLSLTNDIGQNRYQTDLITSIVDGTIKTNGPPTPVPTAPVASAIELSYTSDNQNINLVSSAGEADFGKGEAHFYHLAPFGQAEQLPVLTGEENVRLLPQFRSGTEPNEGEFYIGITGMEPPQNLALLFQVVDGTANPLSTAPPNHIQWSYLSRNTWKDFGSDKVEDRTAGLLKTGIVTFAVPDDATSDNTLMPAGMHWLRAAVTSESDAVCRLIKVAAQALQATFIDQGNDPAFTASVLPAGTISKLAQPNAAVKKITHPFATFGGRGAEAPAAFYTRVSERLRHKERAISLWDYERLVLEHFPQIYKVKCLNHTHYEPGKDIYRELAAGHVTLITLPNTQSQNLRDPLKPYTSLAMLEDIRDFLKKHTSGFLDLHLHVENPQIEEVCTEFNVRFSDRFSGDEIFYINRLKEEITHYLSPWAYAGGSLTFGGKVYKSVLVDFIEDRPYVDYVTDFKLFRLSKEGKSCDLEEVEGSTAVHILVSVPAKDHVILSIHSGA